MCKLGLWCSRNKSTRANRDGPTKSDTRWRKLPCNQKKQVVLRYQLSRRHASREEVFKLCQFLGIEELWGFEHFVQEDNFVAHLCNQSLELGVLLLTLSVQALLLVALLFCKLAGALDRLVVVIS